jgi:hypothetical protein
MVLRTASSQVAKGPEPSHIDAFLRAISGHTKAIGRIEAILRPRFKAKGQGNAKERALKDLGFSASDCAYSNGNARSLLEALRGLERPFKCPLNTFRGLERPRAFKSFREQANSPIAQHLVAVATSSKVS